MMRNFNLTPVFKGMTMKEAWEGDFNLLAKRGMPEEQVMALKAVVEDLKNRSVSEVFEFLADTDPLFHAIYGYGKDDIFVYPFVAGKEIPEGIKEVEGKVGDQSSKWHWESLLEHACYVCAKLKEQGYFSEAEAILLAVWHDIGKKYTSATNHVGGVCFYNHAAVSAFIAAKALVGSKLSVDTGKRLVAIIFGHMQPLTLWNVDKDWQTGKPVDYKMKFFKEMLDFFDGDYAMAGKIVGDIDIFKECDLGIAKEDIDKPEIREAIARGRELILG